MTTIITRVFPDVAKAETAMNRLNLRGLPRRDRQIITGSHHSEADLHQAGVHESATSAYAKQLADGNAVMIVRATYKPLGAARLTRDTLADFETVDMGNVTEEVKLPWQPDHAPSIMKDHPHMLSIPGVTAPGRLSASFGMPMLKERKTKRSLMAHDKRMSRMFWPMPLLSKRKKKASVIDGSRRMSRAFWPMKLLSTGQRSRSVIPGGGTPFSRRMGMKLLS